MRADSAPPFGCVQEDTVASLPAFEARLRRSDTWQTPTMSMKHARLAFVALVACSGASGSNSGGTGGDTRANGGSGGSGGSSGSGGQIGTGGSSGTGGSMTSGGTTTDAGTAGSGGVLGTGGSGGKDVSAETGGASSTGGSTGADAAAHSGKWQVMLLGDSITETTCYPPLLSQELIAKGHTNFAFVGTSLNNQGCGSAPNVQTEGHSCYLVTNLLKDVATVAGCGGTKGSLAELRAWAAEKPEVVLMQFGTNDAWSSVATSDIIKAYGTVVDEFRAKNPSVRLFVAQIPPLHPSGCATCEANVEALNAQIPSWASGKTTTASPVAVVNVWASLPSATYTPNSTYTSDGCHPNPAGSQLIADAWYAGLVDAGIP